MADFRRGWQALYLAHLLRQVREITESDAALTEVLDRTLAFWSQPGTTDHALDGRLKGLVGMVLHQVRAALTVSDPVRRWSRIEPLVEMYQNLGEKSFEHDLFVATKERAYANWEREGRPQGQHLEHWHRAERQVSDQVWHEVTAFLAAETVDDDVRESFTRDVKEKLDLA